MTNKITPAVDYNEWFTQLNEAANPNLIKSPKLLSQQGKVIIKLSGLVADFRGKLYWSQNFYQQVLTFVGLKLICLNSMSALIY